MTIDPQFGRLDAARILAFGGLLLAAGGMVLGEIYAIYISHVANGLIKQHWAAVIQATAAGDISTVTDRFALIADLTARRGRTMNTHSHMGAFGLLALALVHLQTYLGISSAARRVLAIAFLTGAALQLGGVYLSYYVDEWVLFVADAGALLVIAAAGATLVALWRPVGDGPSARALRSLLGSAASRYLVKSGLLLILAGMLFGLYYAWVLVTQDEPAVYAAIDTTVAELVEQRPEEAAAEIARFKSMQSKIAITAASHSHAIEFGFLMLLLALVQKYVLLSSVWQLRWARVLSVGAYLLPVCVFLATRYGLRAAAFADVSGGLVLLAMLAMCFGVIRHTGASDTAASVAGP